MYLYDENVITIKPRRVHLFVRSLSLPFQFLNDRGSAVRYTAMCKPRGHLSDVRLGDLPNIWFAAVCSIDYLLIIEIFLQIFPLVCSGDWIWNMIVWCILVAKKQLRVYFGSKNTGKTIYVEEKAPLGKLLWILNCPTANFTGFPLFPLCFDQLVFCQKLPLPQLSAGRWHCYKWANNKIWNPR